MKYHSHIGYGAERLIPRGESAGPGREHRALTSLREESRRPVGAARTQTVEAAGNRCDRGVVSPRGKTAMMLRGKTAMMLRGKTAMMLRGKTAMMLRGQTAMTFCSKTARLVRDPLAMSEGDPTAAQPGREAGTPPDGAHASPSRLKHRNQAALRPASPGAVAPTPDAEKGASVLLTMLAVGGGVVLALLLGDLSRWVAAQAAVDQAVKAALRCLVATDSECATGEPQGAARERDWYLTHEGRRTVRWIDRYRYEASVVEQDWELEAPGYEIHKVRFPQLGFDGARVPRKTFSRSYNRFVRKLLRLTASGTRPIERLVDGFVPRSSPNFPHFDETYERLLDRAPPPRWTSVGSPSSASASPFPIALQFGTAVSGELPLARGMTARYSTPPVIIPALSDDPSALCVDGSNRCASDLFTASWRTEAALAIKAFATVIRATGPIRVSWSDQLFGSGLSIDLWTRAQVNAWQQTGVLPSPSRSICLGGRTVSDSIERFPSYYHLWLRGPRGAHGGAHAICPGGRTAHWPLIVERGGAFRVRGSLEAESSRSIGAAEIEIRWYYDDYVRHPIRVQEREHFECASVKALRRTDPGTGCPAAEVCSLVPGSTIERCATSIIDEPVCVAERSAEDDPTLFPVAELRCGSEIEAAVCDESWTPPALESCPAVPGRIVCPIQARQTEGSLSLDRLPPGCPLAVPEERRVDCVLDSREVTYRADGRYGAPGQCPALRELFERSATVTGSINERQPAGAPRFTSLDTTELRWLPPGEFDPPRWVQSSVPIDEHGDLIVDSASVRDASFRLKLRRPWLKRSDGGAPDETEFGLAVEGPQQSPLRRSPMLISERVLPITGTFPFSGVAQAELPLLIPDDPQQDCSSSPADLAEVLRWYAERVEPRLSTAAVALNTQARYQDTIILSDQSECDDIVPFALPLPPFNVSGGALSHLGPAKPIEASLLARCSPVRESVVEHRVCAPPEYMGRFSDSTHPLGPDRCAADPLRCSSEPVTTTAPRPRGLGIDPHHAIAAGTRELIRLAGAESGHECSADRCGRIEVTTPEHGPPRVTAIVQIPLSLPLQCITGSALLTVEASGEERAERARL